MSASVGAFLLQAGAISLSGVLAPGPITAATLASGARNRHAGAWVAVGHGIVEFPLMALILCGAGLVLTNQGFRTGVGLVGGVALLLMAILMLATIRKRPNGNASPKAGNPLWIGVVLTGGNPYFLLWWATVGLALATQAMELGLLAFALFALVHWLCDMAWLEILSLASYQGIAFFGPGSQRIVLFVSSAAMAAFGVYFLLGALGIA